jgi:hypothetical protein
MKPVKHIHRRSCYDRRSTSNRRDRWWRVFQRRKAVLNQRMGDERRETPENRSKWERLGRWSSAPMIHPYRDPLLTGIDRTHGYPYW